MALPVYMASTKKSVNQTVGEIMQVLVKNGASQINSVYLAGRITSLRWSMPIGNREQLFDMPVNVQAVMRLLKTKDEDKASRVAWRQLFRWVEAQAALIATGMVRPVDTFAGFAYDSVRDTRMADLLIESPGIIEAVTERKRIG